MSLFKSKYERELETFVARINMDMSNNYKDNAQAGLRDLEARYAEVKTRNSATCILQNATLDL